MFRSISSTLLASVLLAAGLQTVHASAPAKRVLINSVTVSYGDLDLREDIDARVLLTRLEKAAYDACGGDPRFNARYTLMPRYVEKTYTACRTEALSRAITTVDAPALTRLFDGSEAARALPRVASK